MSESSPTALRFARSLYPPEAVEATAAAFGAVAEIELVPEPEHVRAIFHAVHSRLADRLVDEFANQALQRAAAARRAEGGL